MFLKERLESRIINPKEPAIAPNFLVDTAIRAYPEQFSRSLDVRIMENEMMIDIFRLLAKQDSTYKIHLSWFKMVGDIIKYGTPLQKRFSYITQWCYDHGFIEGDELKDPVGFGKEIMDLPASDPLYRNAVDAAFADYWLVKRALAAPNPREIMTHLGFDHLPSNDFDKRNSLLLSGLTAELLKLSRHQNTQTNPLVMEIGAGKCETTPYLIRAGIRPILVDWQPAEYVGGNLVQALAIANISNTEIVWLTDDSQQNQNIIAIHQNPNTVFIAGNTDATRTIPLPNGICAASGSIYVMHHTQEGLPRQKMLGEMLRVSRSLNTNGSREKAVAVFDSRRDASALIGIVNWILAKTQAYNTGLDAITSHARGWKKNEALALGQLTDHNISWHASDHGPNVVTPKGRMVIKPQIVKLLAYELTRR